MKSCNVGKDNPMYGRTHSPAVRKLLSERMKGRLNPNYRGKLRFIGDRSPVWKGDSVKRAPLHKWLRKRLPMPDVCAYCHQAPPFDLANITGIYNREFSNWLYLCRKCHMESDGRLDKLKPRLIDMSNRYCLLCGRNKTVLQVTGRPFWHGYNNNGFICHRCYSRLWWRNNRSPNKSNVCMSRGLSEI